MFRYTFPMFQQFGTSLIVVGSCFAFLFKVYINQRRIWDNLPTSKIELFVTIGICKVIFRRLMILYTQYCPMSVFNCVSSLRFPFFSRLFHLQTSEMVLFLTITIANVAFYWAMVLHVQFLPMNFLLFCVSLFLSPSQYRCFLVVPARSRWFQLVPARSLFQYVRKSPYFVP